MSTHHDVNCDLFPIRCNMRFDSWHSPSHFARFWKMTSIASVQSETLANVQEINGWPSEYRMISRSWISSAVFFLFCLAEGSRIVMLPRSKQWGSRSKSTNEQEQNVYRTDCELASSLCLPQYMFNILTETHKIVLSASIHPLGH
jgi:hypothetical protein